nr:putative swi/snf-related matrix-associated actin-dependent regulator [Quercus suber]
MCRRIVQQSKLVTPAAPETSDADDAEPSSLKGNSSLKVSSLLQLLEKSGDDNLAAKSIIFSQFRKMLMLLVEPLEVAGFRSLPLDGTTNEEVMAKVIKEFGDLGPDAPIVLLASHQASGMGKNLIAASRVYYFLEPWWNAALENQAMDWVHRIGHKEEVKIVRIITRDTIEERILKLQKKR